MSSGDRRRAVRRPVAAEPFRPHASATCPPPADFAVSLASELGGLDADRTERALRALEAAVPVEVEGEPHAQLRALAGVVTRSALSSRRGGELLIDRVLERGHGHPLLVAIVLHELGRRAGLAVGIVAGDCGRFVAHQRLTEPLVLDPVSGRLVDANALGTLHWQCGHQVAASMLDVLQARCERDGDLGRALHVARMRCRLPFEDAGDAGARLLRVTARLN